MSRTRCSSRTPVPLPRAAYFGWPPIPSFAPDPMACNDSKPRRFHGLGRVRLPRFQHICIDVGGCNSDDGPEERKPKREAKCEAASVLPSSRAAGNARGAHGGERNSGACAGRLRLSLLAAGGLNLLVGPSSADSSCPYRRDGATPSANLLTADARALQLAHGLNFHHNHHNEVLSNKAEAAATAVAECHAEAEDLDALRVAHAGQSLRATSTPTHAHPRPTPTHPETPRPRDPPTRGSERHPESNLSNSPTPLRKAAQYRLPNRLEPAEHGYNAAEHLATQRCVHPIRASRRPSCPGEGGVNAGATRTLGGRWKRCNIRINEGVRVPRMSACGQACSSLAPSHSRRWWSTPRGLLNAPQTRCNPLHMWPNPSQIIPILYMAGVA